MKKIPSISTLLAAVLLLAGISLIYTITSRFSPSGQGNFPVALNRLSPHGQLAAVEGSGSGLVGWWKFDEGSGTTAGDSSGSGNAGTLEGSPLPTWTTGKIGGALSFDGVTDTVAIGNPAVLNFGTGSFSYGMWVYPTANTSTWDEAWWKGGGSAANPGYDLELGSGYWTANVSDGTNIYQVILSSTSFLNQWVHIFVVVDRNAGLMKAYLNGQQVSTTSISGLGSVTGPSSASLSTTYRFEGLMDDVRVYNRALSDSEVASIYNEPAAATPTPTPTPTPTGPAPTFAGVSASITSNTTVTISWATDLSATSQVEYGLTSAYGSNTTLDSNLYGSHSVIISGLTPNTVYHYRALSMSSSGVLGQSNDMTFTMPAPTPTPTPPPVPSAPTTYYVCSGVAGLNGATCSPTGSDANAGTSRAAPLASIQHAADLVNPGDTVVVEDGTYTLPSTIGSPSTAVVVNMTRGGAPGYWVTFRSDHKWGAVLDGQNTFGIGFNLGSNSASYIRIQDFTMRNFLDSGVNFNPVRPATSHDFYVVGNHIYNIGRVCSSAPYGMDGSFVSNISNVTFDSNVIHDVGRLSVGENGCTADPYASEDHGLYIDGTQNVVIKNNIIYNMKAGWGVQVWGELGLANNMTIANNTFAFSNSRNTGNIILAHSGVTNSVVENNLFYQPRNAGIYINTTFAATTFSNVLVKNNLAYGAPAVAVDGSSAGVTFENNIDNAADPKLANPTATPPDFHLQAGSSAIDVGATEPLVPVDYDGVSRPVGAAYDIGAYEYPVPVPTPTPTSAPVVTYGLSVTVGSGGSVTSGGGTLIACTSNCQISPAIPGGTITLTANPNAGYVPQWTNCTSVNGTVCTLLMPAANVTVNLSFARDTVPPTVAITSPLTSSLISGAVTLAATAADNPGGSGLATVQFLIDGQALGQPLTTAPYSGSWNTIGVSNTTHTITAVAKDMAGNTTTSNIVIVSVQNTIAPTPTPFASQSPSPSALPAASQSPSSGGTGTSGGTGGGGGGTPNVVGGSSGANASSGGGTNASTGGGGGGGSIPPVTPSIGSFTPTVAQRPLMQSSACTPTQTTITKPLIPALLFTLSLGDRGQNVVTLQNYLIQGGFLPADDNTGYYGPLTQAAIKAYMAAPATLIKTTSCAFQSSGTSRLPQGFTFATTMSPYTTNANVKNLQIFLNDHGFTVSTSGAGSIGNETSYYGPATMKALAKFQAANSISPAVGNFGPITRGVVNQLMVK
ncbi:MAG: peptidoglycan-binding protein [Patescibacteria group bacterium]|nr:peptidoglycan-binding protein [Patescibacteria group bacterium]